MSRSPRGGARLVQYRRIGPKGGGGIVRGIILPSGGELLEPSPSAHSFAIEARGASVYAGQGILCTGAGRDSMPTSMNTHPRHTTLAVTAEVREAAGAAARRPPKAAEPALWAEGYPLRTVGGRTFSL